MRKRRQAALSVELGISQHHLACAVHLARHAVVLYRCESTYQPEMKSEGAKGKARREWWKKKKNAGRVEIKKEASLGEAEAGIRGLELVEVAMFHFFFFFCYLPVGPMTSGRNIRGPSQATHLAALAMLLVIRVPGRSSGNKQCSIGCKASMAVVLAGPLDMPTWSCNTGEHEYLHSSLYWNEAVREH